MSRQPTNTQLEKSYFEVFSEQTRSLFQTIWSMHFLIEKIVEMMRQKLLKNPFFDISKAFKDIDHDGKGYIVAKDVSFYPFSLPFCRCGNSRQTTAWTFHLFRRPLFLTDLKNRCSTKLPMLSLLKKSHQGWDIDQYLK